MRQGLKVVSGKNNPLGAIEYHLKMSRTTPGTSGILSNNKGAKVSN